MRTITRDIVGVILESSDGFLLFGKSRKGGVYQGCWIMPGGGIEPGETPEQALHRELMEETSIDISSAHIRLLSDYRKGSAVKTLRGTNEEVNVDMNFFDYHVTLPATKETTVMAASDDLVELGWFAKSELATVALSPPTIELLHDMKYL